MTSKIRILDDLTINQIAAGEVIENCASVIKELIDNSIDACASEIAIETKGNGRNLIRVSDNGHGMSPDDALLCLERHATSKISTSTDLFQLSTMGFRGEALAAIAAVSKLNILTRTDQHHCAFQVNVEGGKILKTQQAVRKKGTSIEVRSLFYNVPVRREFQKNSNHERLEIAKTLTEIALANPHIKITWMDDEKEQYTLLPKTEDFFYNLKERIVTLFNPEYVSQLIKLDYNHQGHGVKGYIGKSIFHFPNRTGQHLIINGRPIVSVWMANLIREAYGPRLPNHRFPIFILHFELPKETIDANVHPQKKEIRLKNELFIKQFIFDSIDKQLQQQQQVVPITTQLQPSFNVDLQIASPSIERELTSYNVEYKNSPAFFEEKQNEEKSSKEMTVKLGLIEDINVLMIWKNFIFISAENVDEEYKNKIAVFEQRTLEITLIYQRLLNGKDALGSQVLLFPQLLQISIVQSEALQLLTPLFEKIGFSISLMSGNTVMIHAIPISFEVQDVEEFIFGALEDLKGTSASEFMQKDAKKRLGQFLIRSIRMQQLSIDTAKLYIKELLACGCTESPHGKPIYFIVSEEDLNKRFDV